MNLLHAAIGTALAYAGDLPRALIRGALDHTVDRGLELLGSIRPSRVVAREDYIRRFYLGGRVGHRFPEGTKGLLDGLDASVYLHCIQSGDNGLSTHSHPWEWAISIVLAGGYAEEIVAADGSIATRERAPGSVALLSASTFHRITEIRAPRVWTLFLAGPQTVGGDWFFRRPDGSIVHQAEYHANIDAERRREQAWAADPSVPRLTPVLISEAAAKLDTLVGPGRRGLILSTTEEQEGAIAAMMAHGWLRAEDYSDNLVLGRAERPVDERVIKLTTEPRLRGWTGPVWLHGGTDEMLHAVAPLAAAGVPVVISEAEPAIGAPVVQHWPAPTIEKRLTFEDGSVADLLADDPTTIERDLKMRKAADAMQSANWQELDAQRRQVAGEPTAAPDGYRFEPIDAPTVIIRHGDAYVGSLMTNGRAVANGRELPRDEIEKHGAAWEHARSMRTEPSAGSGGALLERLASADQPGKPAYSSNNPARSADEELTR